MLNLPFFSRERACFVLYVCSSLVEQYFGGTLDVELKCKEAEDEPPTRCQEHFLQLSCFIDKEVNYMLSGLRSVSMSMQKPFVGIYLVGVWKLGHCQ